MATPTLTIGVIDAQGPPWGASGDVLGINLANPNQSAPPVTIHLSWPAPTVPLTEVVNAVFFSLNMKWSGFVVARTMNVSGKLMGLTGFPTGPTSAPFILSPSSSQQFRQFQLSCSGLTAQDLKNGVLVQLYGVTGPQVGTTESAADWQMFFSTMSGQGFTGADHGTTPPAPSNPSVEWTSPAPTPLLNLLSNQILTGASANIPKMRALSSSLTGTTPLPSLGIGWSIPTVGGVQPATVGGFPTGTSSTDSSGVAVCPNLSVASTYTGTFTLQASPASGGPYGGDPLRLTVNVWPVPAGGAGSPIFTLLSGGGHWCVAGVPDSIPVQFAASPGYNITVAFGSFVNISSVTIVDASNVPATGPIAQVDATGEWSTNNNASYFRPNYSGAPNTGSYVATFTIKSPDGLTTCATIPVTINVAKTSANLPIQNFVALQTFSEV